MSFKRGEIYECEVSNGTDMKYALIVSCDARQDERYLSVVIMNDVPYGRNPVEIKVRYLCYADCDRVSFVENRRLGNYVRTASEKEMQEIDARLQEALAITAKKAEQIDELRMRLEGAERMLQDKDAEISDLAGKLKEAQGVNVITNQDAVRDLIKAETERDLYKSQYELLLAKLIER